jgi:hypothetical protein
MDNIIKFKLNNSSLLVPKEKEVVDSYIKTLLTRSNRVSES